MRLTALGNASVCHENPKTTEHALEHCRWMVQQMLEHGDRWSERKLNRWLGYVQGQFQMTGIYSIPVLRNHTRHLYDGDKFKHYKGSTYHVLHRGYLSEDPEVEVIVYCGDDLKVWVRPASMWDEKVQWPDGKMRPRFTPEVLAPVEGLKPEPRE